MEKFYPGLLCASIIMVFMGLPGNYFPTVISFWDWLSPDKIAHLSLFAFLSFISLYGYRKILFDPNYKNKKQVIFIKFVNYFVFLRLEIDRIKPKATPKSAAKSTWKFCGNRKVIV